MARRGERSRTIFAANHRDTYRNTLENCLWNHHGWRRYFGFAQHEVRHPAAILLKCPLHDITLHVCFFILLITQG